MRRSGVRIPLAPPQADIRSGCRFFCMPGRCCGACCCVALAPLVFRAPRVLCWAGLLGVPVGGGPPASRPRRELRSARRLEARPGPATAHGHRSLAPPARTGTAASPAYNAIPAAASARSYVGVEPLFRAVNHVEASSHDVRHRGSAPGLAVNRRAMTAPSNA